MLVLVTAGTSAWVAHDDSCVAVAWYPSRYSSSLSLIVGAFGALATPGRRCGRRAIGGGSTVIAAAVSSGSSSSSSSNQQLTAEAGPTESSGGTRRRTAAAGSRLLSRKRRRRRSKGDRSGVDFVRFAMNAQAAPGGQRRGRSAGSSQTKGRDLEVRGEHVAVEVAFALE
jgi:hypothetical protein